MLSFGLASSKLGFEECRFLTSYQSRELAGSEATLPRRGWDNQGCLWPGRGVVAGEMRGQLDLKLTVQPRAQELITYEVLL